MLGLTTLVGAPARAAPSLTMSLVTAWGGHGVPPGGQVRKFTANANQR